MEREHAVSLLGFAEGLLEFNGPTFYGLQDEEPRCLLCEGSAPDESDHERDDLVHEPACPWRFARDAVLAEGESEGGVRGVKDQ